MTGSDAPTNTARTAGSPPPPPPPTTVEDDNRGDHGAEVTFGATYYF